MLYQLSYARKLGVNVRMAVGVSVFLITPTLKLKPTPNSWGR
ncbi:MAG: hypothetical protein OEQ53_01370 [Saprospiraceae bacterium]|nr:hypothetical protein [Saprospiraceae bacterium]